MTTKKASKKAAQESVNETETNEELEDPALFEEMNRDRIPKLERVGRRYLTQKDLVKRETEVRDGLDEECQVIMADHEIEAYRVKGLTLRIKRGKSHIDGEMS